MVIRPEREELPRNHEFVPVLPSAQMLPLRRVQLRKPQNAWPVDRSHCRGNHRAFLDLVAAEAFCFLIFFSSAPIVRATNYDEYRQEARGNRRDGCSANLAHPI